MGFVNATRSRESLEGLLAERQYSRALPILHEICRRQPRNLKKRQQLAEVLSEVGEKRKAFKVLEELVTDYAHIGQVASAIATVKRMQAIEPGRQDLAMKLAALVKGQDRRGPREDGSPPASPVGPAIKRQRPARAGEGRAGVSRLEDIVLEGSMADVLMLNPSELLDGKDLLRGSKLLQGFTAEELEALIGELQLTSHHPGEIVVSEGEPGDSLYLIASGSVRVYVRNKRGAQNQVRVMHQGDFFGEISLLKKTARTATITAATPVELLELDRRAVGSIAARHPDVWRTIEDFCTRREGSLEELGARRRD